uniref:Uncharacterized protein n=1 Tax=Megaselia scalaris TaxID=36166 RepID=T1GCT6_MEGSC
MKFKILLFTVFSTLSLTLGNPTSTEPPFYVS